MGTRRWRLSWTPPDVQPEGTEADLLFPLCETKKKICFSQSFYSFLLITKVMLVCNNWLNISLLIERVIDRKIITPCFDNYFWELSKLKKSTIRSNLFDWQAAQHKSYRLDFIAGRFCSAYTFPSVCECQRSIDELSTMLNGTVLAAQTARPNLRVRDKCHAPRWAGKRTSHQRRRDSRGRHKAGRWRVSN